MTPKWKLILSSRKFWACVVGLLFVVLQAYSPNFPLSEDMVLTATLLLVSYILGTAIEDHSRSV